MSSSETAMIVAADAGDGMHTAPVAHAANPLHQMHSLLRGRYWLAILLAAIGGGVGGWFGYRLQRPTFQSVGLVRITPNLPRILYQSDQNGVMPMFDAFIESQVSLIHSQRVMDLAMQDPDWRALRRGLSPEQMQDFAENLSASHPRGSELVMVTFTDPDAEAAQRGAAAVIAAYDQLYGEKEASGVQARIKLLEDRKTTLQGLYDKNRQDIAGVCGVIASGSMNQLYDTKLAELSRIETQLHEAELVVALAGGSAAATQPAQKQTRTLTAEALAAHVPEVAKLLSYKRDIERQLAGDRTQFGEDHHRVLEAKAQVAALSAQIEDLVQTYQTAETEPALPRYAGKSVEELKGNLADVRKLFDRVKAETEALGRTCVQVDQLKSEADANKARLDETNQRIDQLNTEAHIGGRISIESRGDRPLAPVKDKRIALAAVGGLGLGSIGVGFVLLLGLMDRRIRHISDIQGGPRQSRRILGVLPALPNEETDPEQAMVAAHAVHQIRMLLQHRQPAVQKPVIAISSASPGAGKTSLTTALGLSFAASGARTLMIDCDIIGGGLTSKMKKVTRRRLGHMLRRAGLINSVQLVAALKESKRRKKKIGQVLVHQKLVSEADIERAVEAQQDALVGLREALNGDPAHECITDAGSEGLFLMPLGSARRQHVAQLSYPALRRIIDETRRWFDVILIDTGPILGSLEASVVAMAADEVVLTVAKGEHRPSVGRAIECLETCGGRLAGIVLNRAAPGDLISSGFSSSNNQMSGEDEAACSAQLKIIDHRGMRLGPIGSAVIAVSDAHSDDAKPSN